MHTCKKLINKKCKTTAKSRLAKVPIELLREAAAQALPLDELAPVFPPAAFVAPPSPASSHSDPRNARGFLYMLREREFLKTKEHIFKVGKTVQELQKRICKYPKGSELLLAVKVPDCHKGEIRLLRYMRENFISRKDIGAEYFEGEELDIQRAFYHALNTTKNLNDLKSEDKTYIKNE